MKTIWDYPVSYPYGYSLGYDGFHRGEDRGNSSAFGLPVTVNGVTIGLVGWTGKVVPKSKNGTHTHIGKWLGLQSYNPAGGGMTFKSAIVTGVDAVGNTDSGKFVRVQGDGYSWVYCHLDSVNVVIGQELKEESVSCKPDPETFANQIRLAYEEATEKQPTDEQLAAQLSQPDLSHVLISIKEDSQRAWAALHKQSDDKNIIIDDLRAQLNAEATALSPGKYLVS